MQTLEITNIGPVPNFKLTVPDDGGVVVLRARNGRGKTKTLETYEKAISGRGSLDVRDGQVAGEFNGFGVSINVTSRTTRSGELEVESLEGKFSVATLVEPPVKDPEAADIRRIKALVQLSNVLPSAELFHSIVSSKEEFAQLVGSSALEAKDLVTMAELIKRDLQVVAREVEKQLRTAETNARAARAAAEGIDTNVETDAATLQEALNAAIRHEERLNAQRSEAVRGREIFDAATLQLQRAESEYNGPTIAAAIAAEELAKAAQVAAEEPVRVLSEQVRTAKHVAELAGQKLSSCSTAARQARAEEGKAKAAVSDAAATVRSLEEQLRLARQHLSTAEDQFKQWTSKAAEASQSEIAAKDAATETSATANQLKVQLQAAKQGNELACQAMANCSAARKTAEQHDAAMAKWRQQLESAVPVEPAPELLTEAAAAIKRCHEANDLAGRARRANEQLENARRFDEVAKQHQKRADSLRNSADRTDNVLSEIVSQFSNVLRVEAGRLVLDTDRGVTNFGDLSQGERWKIALDIAADVLGERGVMVIPQEAWESLDPTNRTLVRNHVKRRRITILTAEASDDEEIVAEEFVPTVNEARRGIAG
jgi:hypothetical protein